MELKKYAHDISVEISWESKQCAHDISCEISWGSQIMLTICPLKYLGVSRLFRAMLSHIIEVLSLCWSGVVLGHGLGQRLGRD